MQVVEVRQRQISRLLEVGESIDQDLGLGAYEHFIFGDRRRFEETCILVGRARLRRRDVFNARLNATILHVES
jgi:hypothetical protein